MTSKLKHISTILVLLTLTGCEQYTVSFNDREIYTPPPLFNDFAIKDKALSRCVTQVISDFQIKKASELTQLSCSYAGVTSLEGLERFAQLKQINLSDNKIANIAPLSKLPHLTLLMLKNNQIADPSPLLANIKLKTLNMDGNASLKCTDIHQVVDLIRQESSALAADDSVPEDERQITPAPSQEGPEADSGEEYSRNAIVLPEHCR